jgi:DNA-binding NarL/FixJ family response regulator
MTKTHVLLADDHALVRAGIRNALEEIPDLEVVSEVGDGQALLAALEATHPELILVDLRMPEFSPLVTIQQIRNRYPQIHILVVSAYDDEVYVQGLLEMGVDGYHLKDQPLSDLKLAVQRILAGKRWISSPLVDKLVHGANSATDMTGGLTPRQCDLLRLLQQGFDNQHMAQHLGLSVKTIENHLTRLYRRLNVQSRLEAANYAMLHPEILGLTGSKMTKQSSMPAQSTSASQIRFLVVDDSYRYRTQLRRMIGYVHPGAVVYEADNTAEALRLAQELELTMAFVDVVLGDEDGINCARRLGALSSKIRVVLISAYPDREFHRLGLEAGAIAFLDKQDLDRTTIQQIIEDIVG